MEGILREPDLPEIEKLFEQSYKADNPVVYFPVRHHSPACALHLRRTIEAYMPDLVLIEGPSDSEQLLPYIADSSSVPPFCIYYSYDDKEGKVDEEREKYRAYYPFLAYSPELVAIREAAARKVPVRFIDMPYALRLIYRRNSRIPVPLCGMSFIWVISCVWLLRQRNGRFGKTASAKSIWQRKYETLCRTINAFW